MQWWRYCWRSRCGVASHHMSSVLFLTANLLFIIGKRRKEAYRQNKICEFQERRLARITEETVQNSCCTLQDGLLDPLLGWNCPPLFHTGTNSIGWLRRTVSVHNHLQILTDVLFQGCHGPYLWCYVKLPMPNMLDPSRGDLKIS